MDPWIVLNIQKTGDKEAVKRAYMSQLVKHNPEDDPDGFQRVRNAFEQIILELDKTAEDTPVGNFINKAASIYEDFTKRISVNNWRELLQADVCTQLATEDEASMRLLEFLMEHWYLPGEVLHVLNNHFCWLDKKDELLSLIPSGFIAFIENQMQIDYPNYKLFETTANPDRFIYLFHETETMLNNGALEQVDALIDEMEDTGIKHPCLLHLKSRYALMRNEFDKALNYAKTAMLRYPEDIDTRFTYAQALLVNERVEEALDIFIMLQEEHPSHFGAERGVIECLLSLGDYEEARERLLAAHEKHPSSAYVMTAVHYVSEKLVEKYSELHQENPDDIETTFMLAKHYLNRMRFDDCLELLSNCANPDSNVRYYEFMGECYLQKGDLETSVEYFLKDIAIQRKYLNYVKLAFALNELRRYDDAIRYIDDALTLSDDDTVSKASLYNAKGMAYHRLGDNDSALEAYNAGISANENLYYLYTGKANIYKDMYMYAEAIDCCAKSIALLPYNPEPYAIEMEIYLLADQANRVFDLIAQAELYQIGEFPCIKYYKACALSNLAKTDEAMDILTELIVDEEFEDKEYKPRIYREMAFISEWRGDVGQAIGYLKKAIEHDEKKQWIIWELHLGQLYNKLGDGKNALKIFKRIITEGKFGIIAHIELGHSYLLRYNPWLANAAFENAVALPGCCEADYDRIIRIYTERNMHDAALTWAQRALKVHDSAENRIQVALVLTNLNRITEAIWYLERAKRKFPRNEFLHERLALLYRDKKGNYQKALDEYYSLLNIAPHWPYIYEEIGYCMARLGKFDDAIKLLTDAIEDEPDNMSLYVRRGFVYNDMNRQSEAINDFTHSLSEVDTLKTYWNISHVYHLLGGIYEEHFNDAQSALKYYDLALECDDELFYTMLSVGDINAHLKNYQEALKWYDRALGINQKHPECFSRRAYIYKMLGEKKLAVSNYIRALKQFRRRPRNACRYAKIGECYLGLGNYKKALFFIELAIKNAGSCVDCPPRACHEAHYYMSLYYIEVNQPDKALECINTAIGIANHVQYNQLKMELV